MKEPRILLDVSAGAYRLEVSTKRAALTQARPGVMGHGARYTGRTWFVFWSRRPYYWFGHFLKTYLIDTSPRRESPVTAGPVSLTATPGETSCPTTPA